MNPLSVAQVTIFLSHKIFFHVNLADVPNVTNPPDLEGMDEDRLRDLQNAIQEQLRQRDEERERNITKRV